MPTTIELEQILGKENFFILYKPRNIVSGDFYWFADKGESKIFAVADCTGHGVPGAFMSMIGNALLNYIIHDKEIHLPHLILTYMNEGLEKAFHQNTEEGVNDTIEIALITIQKTNNILLYAGAMSSMYMIQNDNLEIWKGDKFSLGDRNTTKEKVFTQSEIPILPQTTHIYLFSDGYQDQFGGYHHKKFMSKQFRKVLFDNYQKNMSEQQQILDMTINQWIGMGNETQTDDITILGLRL